MSLDHRLIDLLVCPVCKGPLKAVRDAQNRLVELCCAPDRLAFPIRDGIPIMLEDEARATGVAEGVSGGVAGGVAEGVTKGVPEGVTGGVTGGVAEGVTGSVTKATPSEP